MAGGDGNGYVRGLETLLVHAGAPVDYNRLMGLSGTAFIFQADSEHRWEGKVDAGWWPLDPWGLKLYREFLSRAVGFELKEVGPFYDSQHWPASRDDRRDFYIKQIHADVVRQIDAGHPVLSTFFPAHAIWAYVITGYDHGLATDKPPIWGRCARETELKNCNYADDWPWAVLVIGKRTDPMDADAADLTALRHAVALAHDQAGPTEAPWAGRRFTGQKAWTAWAALLRNEDEAVDDHAHWNVRNGLIRNRTAAVAYVQRVAQRREGQAAEALRAVAAAYENVLEPINRLDFSGISTDAAKRRQQADAVDIIAALEKEAITHLQRAIDALK
ncbi:MAG: hypothetical protein FWE88_08285 [Phycisphaerae bacterium]|nr:hypothetical protein [Phycisphaerae bacterium]